LRIDYVLADYTNLLDTGYNGSTHTEPYYRCHSYLIQYSGNPFVSTEDLTLTDNSGSVIVYPNPFRESFTVRSEGAKIESIYLYRIDGGLAFKQEYIDAYDYQANVRQQPPGLYVLRVKTDKGFSVFKISRQ